MVKFILLLLMTVSCSNRSFWRYVVDDPVNKPLANRDQGSSDAPRMLSPHNVKVVFNDGSKSTEVLIPIVSSGQQVLIDHQGKAATKSIGLVPLPPTAADQDIEKNYLESGKKLTSKAPPVSIINTQKQIRDLVRDGNYALALEYAEQLLARYPSHAPSWRTKGSLLLKMGEKEAALKAYERAQELEPDPGVAELIKKIEKGQAVD
jgi:tetratricopeptide (TPR) repeat protein